MVETLIGVIGEIVTNVTDELNCSLEVTLSELFVLRMLWRVYLVFGRTPSFWLESYDKEAALEDQIISDIVGQSFNAMYSAILGFIAAESFKKIRWALIHNVRISRNVKYFTQDSVIYKKR